MPPILPKTQTPDVPRLLIHGGRLIDPAQGIDGALDLLLEDGAVAQVGERLKRPRMRRRSTPPDWSSARG